MEEENKEDLKEEQEGTPDEDESSSEENPSKVEGDLKNDEDDASTVADELLKDGTGVDKKINVNKRKYDENAEKAKLYDSFNPLLAKLNQNPDLVDQIMDNKGGESVEDRVKRLEEREATAKRGETKAVITEAVKTWPNFKEQWGEIQPIVKSLESMGVPYAQAVQRGYFAINPDAARESARLAEQHNANMMQNQAGTMGSSGGASKQVHEDIGQIDSHTIEMAHRAGVDPKLYKKHEKHIAHLKDL
jgi:putative heme iron utilization protein